MDRLLVLAGCAAWLLAGVAPASAAASQCTAAQYKASGAYAKRVAGCHAKALKRGDPVDALCLAKALSKLQKAAAKAEAKGDCLGASVPDELKDSTDRGIDELAAIIEPPPGTCCAAPAACYWAPDAATCTASTGTPGPAGSVCRADATCGDPPAGATHCCEGVPLPPLVGVCAAGPLLTSTACSGSGGSFHAAAACRPDQLCHD
jgi:hypothetical protein